MNLLVVGKKSLNFRFGGGSGFIGQPELFPPASI